MPPKKTQRKKKDIIVEIQSNEISTQDMDVETPLLPPVIIETEPISEPITKSKKSNKNFEDVKKTSNSTTVSFSNQLRNYRRRFIPSVSDLANDPIIKIANEYWKDESAKFEEDILQMLFEKELSRNGSAIKILEISGYLENYLWHFFSPESSFEHVFSIIIMVNEKCKAGLVGFDILMEDTSKCTTFYESIADILLLRDVPSILLEPYTFFITNSYRSLENPVMRVATLKYLSLPIWENLSKTRLDLELEKNKQLKKHWDQLRKIKAKSQSSNVDTSVVKQSSKRKRKSEPMEEQPVIGTTQVNLTSRESTWIFKFLRLFLTKFQQLNGGDGSVKFIERFLELIIDLLSQLPTRRFLKVLLEDIHFIPHLKSSDITQIVEGSLIIKLLDIVDVYMNFEVDDLTGRALNKKEMMEIQNEKIYLLQKIAHNDYPLKLQDMVFSSMGEVGKREFLVKSFESLTKDELFDVAKKMHILTEHDFDQNINLDSEFALNLIIDYIVPRPSKVDEINMLPLFPTEELLWDENQLPLSSTFNGNQVLALPKLNLQFLTIQDYLMRNFVLFRLESSYEIREDLIDAIKRMGPKQLLKGPVSFGGWARMALPITSITIDEISRPKLGDLIPKHVDSTVTIDLSRFSGIIRQEWEDLREHDVIFLVCIERPHPDAASQLAAFEKERKVLAQGERPRVNKDFDTTEESFDFPSLFGIKYVRGGEVFELRDEENVILNDLTKPDERPQGRVGHKRKIRIHLDPAQYYIDIKEGRNCYETMNLVVRRDPKENNFRAILETIRNLMNTAAVGRAIPAWLHDIFLGYGNPTAANYRSLSSSNENIELTDYHDTFIDGHHIIEAFPKAEDISFSAPSGDIIIVKKDNIITASNSIVLPSAPYKLEITRGSDVSENKIQSIVVKSYMESMRGPYREDQPPRNAVRFTPVQIEAIRSGVNEGLTMVVGPPGTGKTDVAVQIIANIYHNFPTQKILIVTHSNAALNDLFEKIMERDVAPRHLLRLGSGERELRETLAVSGAGGGGRGQGEVFSKQGRVNWSLSRRLQLLSQVHRLSSSLEIMGDYANSCETAVYFDLEHIKPRIDKFHKQVTNNNSIRIQEIFPFLNYFNDVPHLFNGDQSHDLESALGCFTHINNIFTELNDYRAFELLRTQSLRSDYLLTKQARIVAMTCTHAAMTRKRLTELGFKYDSIIMEEAAQILEVETLIPMLLQDTDPVDGCRLKRVVLIGDHFQLPPVVKHLALQKFSRLDQSLFSRFIRLGVPSVQLDQQGRARAEISALYSWRYTSQGKSLGDLPLVQQSRSFQKANAGFVHNFQFIDVPYFEGKGESTPTPYFYQNLGEAEYIVAVYQYMRLIGYPSDKITILTTYNGQKHLIRDILAKRCANKLFGIPTVSTVDKYQGQQNDYILLSLVRTESIGHIRDVRRLIVALSRARLGLYVFGFLSIYENCFELSPAISRMLVNPTKLMLIAGEGFPTNRITNDSSVVNAEANCHTIEGVTSMGVLVYQMINYTKSLTGN
eukprot:gene5853-8076_t